ncbi:hypothetical protein PEC18_09880 [Paucibacter sp. O1-1]|nr:hypothetical protein [Paucibacter sp. O1-1]MDA3826156.1 hypothetical protein [Paucibacter sp. O1-1]
MTQSKASVSIGLMVLSLTLLSGCEFSSGDKIEPTIKTTGIDLGMFTEGAFTQPPKIVECETAQGTVTTCYEFTTSGAPAGREPGPFAQEILPMVPRLVVRGSVKRAVAIWWISLVNLS